MNRCRTPASDCPRSSARASTPAHRARLRAPLLCLWLLAVVPLPGQAQEMQPVRQFPPTVQRGMLTVVAPPAVQINGDAEKLSPGVRIRGPNNMLLMSGALVGQTMAVNYLRERNSGMLQEIWILNDAELQAQRSGWDVIRNFRFGSDGDGVKRDDGKTPFDQLPKYPKQ